MKIRLFVVAAVAALTVFPAVTPASASHTCALDETSQEADTICENYHNPKPLIGYIFCLVSPTC